jgi:2-polyprenyl-6-methoxyphenol hydroxylase-like FAD-dependent oxidoreductase
VLSPNSLRIFDALGVHPQLVAAGVEVKTMTMKDNMYRTTKLINFGDADRYGYLPLRIKRASIISTLLAALGKDFPIHHDYRFSRADEEPSSIHVSFSNGVEKFASLLVGADGIRSHVRATAFKDTPDFTYAGQAGLAWAIPHSKLRYPVEVKYEDSLAAIDGAIMPTPKGMVTFMSGGEDGSFINFRVSLPLQDRNFEEWKALGDDREALREALCDGLEDMPDLAKSAIEYALKEDVGVFLWPFYVLSNVKSWVSEDGDGRIVLIGDAAHAFPPTGGNGANMAVEDAYGLALLLSSAGGAKDLKQALNWWESWRRQRIIKVTAETERVGKSRVLPKQGAAGIGAEAMVVAPKATRDDLPDMDWLYNWKPEEQLREWLKGQGNER